MRRYQSAYLYSQRLDHHRELFRTAKLNAVGWAAVAGLCAAGAGAGLVAARLTSGAVWVAMPAGTAAVLAGLIAADRRKWAAMATSYSWTDKLGDVERIADLLTRRGVAVAVEVDEFDQPMLQCLNRDRRHVRRALRSAGLPPPPRN